MGLIFMKVDHTKLNKFEVAVLKVYYPISHKIGARIHAQNDLIHFYLKIFNNYRKNLAFLLDIPAISQNLLNPMILNVLIVIIIFSYLLFVFFQICGWRRLKRPEGAGNPRLYFSVIIPVRDEVKYVAGLIRCLEVQTYPKQNFEVIFVDDNSKDGTYPKLLELSRINDLKIKVIQLPDEEDNSISHKKAAITLGIQEATGDIILMTDADVEMGKNWIQDYARKFSSSDIQFISGPVMMKEGRFFGELQSIEFASLIGVGGAMLYYRKPVMCNGANLAYRREAFFEVGGYEDNRHVISGDDEFLMYKISKRYPAGTIFMKSKQSTVTVKPVSRFSEFYNQRRRWSGKWKQHPNLRSKVLALYIFMVHCTFLASIALGILGEIPSPVFLFLWISKIITEYIFLLVIYTFFSRRLKIFPFLMCSLLYSFYAVTFGILSNFGGYVWKGRLYKN